MKKQLILVTMIVCSILCLIYQRFVPLKAASPGEKEMNLISPAFSNNTFIPKKYAHDGENMNPSLQWQGVPLQAKSLALIVSDPDAPEPKPWIHWAVFNISPTTQELKEGAAPHGAKLGMNNVQREYYGPRPPKGHGIHHYHFTLYALDSMLDLPDGVPYATLYQGMQKHILEKADLIGLYETK